MVKSIHKLPVCDDWGVFSNMTGVTCGARTAYPSRATEFTPCLLNTKELINVYLHAECEHCKVIYRVDV